MSIIIQAYAAHEAGGELKPFEYIDFGHRDEKIGDKIAEIILVLFFKFIYF